MNRAPLQIHALTATPPTVQAAGGTLATLNAGGTLTLRPRAAVVTNDDAAMSSRPAGIKMAPSSSVVLPGSDLATGWQSWLSWMFQATGGGVPFPTDWSGSLPTGPAGPTGVGITGPQGPTGVGMTGPQGVTGVGMTGPQGVTGSSAGYTGPQGVTGVGVTGPTGVGVTGPQGVPGVGITGPTGPAGKTAIVPTSRGPVAIFCVESPEVWITDTLEMTVCGGDALPLPPLLLEICEPGSVRVASVVAATAVPVGASVQGGYIVFDTPGLAVRVCVIVQGIRAGFAGVRFPARTQKQMERNNAHWREISAV